MAMEQKAPVLEDWYELYFMELWSTFNLSSFYSWGFSKLMPVIILSLSNDLVQIQILLTWFK